MRVNSPISNRRPLDHRGATGRPQQSRCSWSGGVEPAAHARSTLPRGHTHTDARSAKKDVISTKPQKAMGAERTFPREDKESRRTPSLRTVSPAMCRRYRGTLSCAGRASGGGGHSPWSGYWGVTVSSLGVAKNFDFVRLVRARGGTSCAILPSFWGPFSLSTNETRLRLSEHCERCHPLMRSLFYIHNFRVWGRQARGRVDTDGEGCKSRLESPLRRI